MECLKYRKPFVEVVEPYWCPDFTEPVKLNVGDRFLLIGAKACYSYQDYDENLTNLAQADGKLDEGFTAVAMREDERDSSEDAMAFVYWVFTVLGPDGRVFEADAQRFKFVDF